MHNAPQPTARQRMRFWLTTAIGAVLSTPSIERRRRKACKGSRSWRRSHHALIKTPSVAQWTSAWQPIILLGACLLCLLCLVATCPQDVGAADPKQTGEADLWGRVDLDSATSAGSFFQNVSPTWRFPRTNESGPC